MRKKRCRQSTTSAPGAFTGPAEPSPGLAPTNKPFVTLYGALKGQIAIFGEIVCCDWSHEFEALRR